MDDIINTFCFPKLLTTFRETPSFLKYLCMHPSSGAYLGSDCGYSSLSSDPDSFRSFSQLFRGGSEGVHNPVFPVYQQKKNSQPIAMGEARHPSVEAQFHHLYLILSRKRIKNCNFSGGDIPA